MTAATIRRAILADSRPLAEMHVASWQAAYRDLLPASFLASLSVTRRTASWKEWLADEQRQVWVIVDEDGRIAGNVSFGATRDSDLDACTVGEVYGIYLHPDYWGKGYGKRLMTRALAELSAQGFTTVTLWVLAGNERAKRFYQRQGFYPDGAAKSEHRDPDVTLHEVRYRRALPLAT